MEKPVAKIGRENHFGHLAKTMPLITAIFIIQCYIMKNLDINIDLGTYAMVLGGCLVFLIGSLAYYDMNHHVLIFNNHIKIYYRLMGTNIDINLSDITEIIAPDEECLFSNIIIKTKDQQKFILFFVDYPKQVKKLIEAQIKGDNVTDFFQDAA